MSKKRLIRKIKPDLHSKQHQRKLLKEIMEADEKDGLYEANDWYVTTTGNSWSIESGGGQSDYQTHKQSSEHSFISTYVSIGNTILDLPKDPNKFLEVLEYFLDQEVPSLMLLQIPKGAVSLSKDILTVVQHSPTRMGYESGAIYIEWKNGSTKAKACVYEDYILYQCKDQMWFDWDVVDLADLNKYIKELYI